MRAGKIFSGCCIRIGIAAVLLAGCASEKETGSDVGLLSSAEIISRVNAMSASIKTYSALGSVSVETPQISQSAGFEISIKKPDSAFISVDGPFGITIGRVLYTTKAMKAYNALNNTLYEGNPEQGMQALPFFAGLQPDIVIDAMSGVRRFNNGFTRPDSFSFSGRSYRFSFNGSTRRTVIVVDARSMHITRVRTYATDDDRLLWEERYSYVQSGDTVWKPESVFITLPERSMNLEFLFDDIQVNPLLPDFVLEFPDDAERMTFH